MAKPEEYLVGIDIGSSKIGVLIGQRATKGGIEVVGRGEAPNRGTRKGNIVNVEATVEALKAATEEAEVMAGVEVSRAYVGVAGAVTRNKTLLTGVSRAGIEVAEMVFEPLATAEGVLTPDERELGTLLLDMGAGSMSCSLFQDGEIQYSAVLPIGAGHFTNDL